MHFQCKFCKGIVEANELQLGEEVQCGHCDQVVKVPVGQFSPGVIIGDFCIEREIAKGGMGVVFLSRQISLDRPAALKILQPHLVNDKTLITGLIQEARAAAKLNHPNIVQAYAVGEDEGIFFFAMEFVDGPTMKAVLKQEKTIPPRQAAEIIMQIADALQCAWTEQKLTHRDLKPDNIIMSSNGRAKLADLGLSHVGDAKDEDDSEEVLGTPQYISPEQLTGTPIDTRSDLYSLGATFFQFVTGRFPYIGKDADEIVRQHVEGTLTPPMQINPQLPKQLNDIIVKLMQKDPKQRFQTPAELVVALKAFLDGQSGANASQQQPVRIGGAPSLTQNAPLVTIKPPQGQPMKINIKQPGAQAAMPPPPVPQPAAAPLPAAPTAAPQPAADPAVNGASTRTMEAAQAPLPMMKKAATPAPSPAPESDTPAATTEDPTRRKVKTSPARSPEAKKQQIKLIAAIVLLVGAAAIAFYMYGGADLFASSEQSESVAATSVATVAATPQATVPVVGASYRDEVNALLQLHQTGTQEDFLSACDQFFKKYPQPENAAATEQDVQLRRFYAAAEEAVRAPGARQSQEKARAEELRRRAAAIAEAEAEADQARRSENDLKALTTEIETRLAANTTSFMADMATVKKNLSGAFLQGLLENKPAVWQEAWERNNLTFRSPWPELTVEGKKQADADLAYFEAMNKDFEELRKFLGICRENMNYIWGTQWEEPGSDLYKLIAVKDGVLTFESLFDKKITVNKKWSELSPESLHAMAIRADKKSKVNGSLFFCMLSIGEADPAMSAIAPEGFWKDHFAEMAEALGRGQ